MRKVTENAKSDWLNPDVDQVTLDSYISEHFGDAKTAFFRAILESLHGGVTVRDADGELILANSSAIETFGLAKDEISLRALAECDLTIVHADGSPFYSDDYPSIAALRTGIEQRDIEMGIKRRGSPTTWISLNAQPIRHPETGQIQGVVTSFVDISKRRRMEADLRESEEHLRLAVEGGGVGTWQWDLDTGEVVCSELMMAMRGHPGVQPGSFDKFLHSVHPDDRAHKKAIMDDILTSARDYDLELRVQWPDGTVRWISERGRPYVDETGKPMRVMGVGIDITDRKVAEQEFRHRAKFETVINRVGEAVRTNADPERVKATAVRLLGEALQVDRCYFAVYDLVRGVVDVSDDWHRSDLKSIKGKHAFTNTADMFAELYQGSPTSLIADRLTAALSPITKANMESLQIRARASVAVADTNGMATLSACMSDAPREWLQVEVELLEKVATILRSAIELARVQQREHRIATELQEALMPTIPTSIPALKLACYMSPALNEAAIGGDFCDVFSLTEGSYAIIIGDVSGKGLAAGAQLATFRNMLRGYMYQHLDPADAVNVLNTILITHQLLTGFVTAFVGVYDAASGTVQYASCGHELGLIRRAKSDTIETLQNTGPVLGVIENADYIMNSVQLHKDDTLLLYTDGITEAGPTRTDLLGLDGLIRIYSEIPGNINESETAQRLVAAATEYAQFGLRDDVCVLVARRI